MGEELRVMLVGWGERWHVCKGVERDGFAMAVG